MKYGQFLVLVSFVICSGISWVTAQDPKAEKWNVNNPVEPFSTTTIETSEGTWMNLDVSPDGKTIVFDMLGDIYSMPVEGGTARVLREGHAFEIQPRFSPDGKKIAFTTDAGGGDNIWIMDNNGENGRQLTKESFRLLNNPVWTPDGQYIVARKHFTSQRSLGAGEMWLYHLGGGDGIQLTKRKNDQQDAGEPWVSPDGRYIYFSEDMAGGGFFQYNKDPNSQIYVIRRYDCEKGTIENVIQGPGGAVRPQISPDGKKLAFVRRVRTKSVLYIHELSTGIQTPVYDQLSKDQQEVWAIFGVYPNYNWLPDNKHVIVWAGGKIMKVNTEEGTAQEIPFVAKATHKITDAIQFKVNPAPDSFQARVIRNAKTSPDGKTLVFNAAGYLWIKSMPDGKPRRLTNGTDLEFEPSFSPDGKTIIFVTWNDETKGAICSVPVKGGAIAKLTSEKGMYRTPSYSPDGLKIIFRKEGGNSAMGYAYAVNPGIYTMKATGGTGTFLMKEGENPVFSAGGDRIFYLNDDDLDKTYCSVDLNGQDKKIHFHSKYANHFSLSPDNQWLAFGELYYVYVIPFAAHGQVFELSGDLKTVPIAKVSDEAGTNLHWSANGQKVYWTLGANHYAAELKNCFPFLSGLSDSTGTIPKTITDTGLTLPTDTPKGKIAITGATIITMKGDEVIENGTVIIENNKIIAVGSAGQVAIPQDALQVAAGGKVVMPGIIDTHAHLNAFRLGMSPQKEWPYYANLAYGITATHDPSTSTEMALSQSEMVKAGSMVGPRIFSTGTILYGAEGDFKAVINNYEDAKFSIARTKAYGAFSVKSYNQPRREQRQQVIKAARDLGIMVYPEGGSTFFHNLTMILDGHTSIEHNVPIAPLYNDVIQLWAASKTANTPTLIVNYGGLNGEYYWYQTTNVWEEQKLLKYTPRSVIDSRSRHRTMAPMEEYENGHILTSQSCKKLVDAGVHVCVGGHGQLQGLGVLWEMWNLSQGGMTNMEVLRAATIHGAEYIGMEQQLGSIEVGKLADIIVLDENPLEDIHHINSVMYTIVNGRMYDTETMDEVGNYNKPRSKFFWEQEGYNDNFEWHAESHSFTGIGCSCHQ
ncbi:MAG: amidohydrolase family protein [Cyclobacteriaceae bacterium]|nr:amidohydrolase family protein [Cyclobacteriaceae bacterium]